MPSWNYLKLFFSFPLNWTFLLCFFKGPLNKTSDYSCIFPGVQLLQHIYALNPLKSVNVQQNVCIKRQSEKKDLWLRHDCYCQCFSKCWSRGDFQTRLFFFLLRIEALTKAERADREIKVPLFQSSNIRLKLINIRDRKHLLNYLTDCGKGCAWITKLFYFGKKKRKRNGASFRIRKNDFE